MKKEIMIGLETHLQLMSDTKLLCGCPTSGKDIPNTRTCPTCLGMPGSRPRINKRVIEMGIKIAEALNCDIAEEMNFSRKSYFYPDMPKNFQTTQYSIPLGRNGHVEMKINGKKKKIRIKRIHLEEDPGKVKHVGGDITSSDYILVDYNRSGVPLAEIVTEPDLESPKEARIFIRRLANIFEYLKVYDSGSGASIRSDANISLDGGERVEVKNITGASGIEKAMKYEIKRQKKLIKNGEDVVMETRGFDDENNLTRPLRKKEEEAEYGYIFEPDLTEISITREWINELTEEMPELPHKKRERYKEELELSEEMAQTICSEFDLAKTFEKTRKEIGTDLATKIITGPVKKTLNYNEIRFSESKLNPEKIIEVSEMIKSEKITERNAEMLIRKLVKEGGKPESVAEEMGLGKVKGGEIDEAAEDVLSEERDAAEDYKQGKEEALNYLMGKVMEKTKGKADPGKAREILKEKLNG